jgi:hypothetical protein
LSKYKIYRIDHFDPAVLGKRRKRLSIVIAAGGLIYVPVAFGIRWLFNIEFAAANFLAMMIMLGASYAAYRILKSKNEKLQVIGNIEFTRTGIIKHLGDDCTEIPLTSVQLIEITKHIPAASPGESKTGFLTYILTIFFRDDHKESLVVSDKPLGKVRDLSITETLKTINKLTATEIKLS